MRRVVYRNPFRVVYVPDDDGPQLPQPDTPPNDGAPASRPPPVAPQPGSAPEATRFDWLCAAAQQPGKAAHLALMLAWQAASAGSPAVRPGSRQLRRFGVSRDACYDGLRRLEDAKLVHVWRLPGRLPQVILVEPGTDRPLRVQ